MDYRVRMRADRLVSLILLLRHRGRLSAPALARELEVSTRTVLRDVEALSAAGIPVYADRGRYGGFSLAPGFRTQLTDVTPEEAGAMLAAAGAGTGRGLGLGPAHTAAALKLLDALPLSQRAAAESLARRILIEPEADLLARSLRAESIAAAVLTPVRRAVVEGLRLEIDYAPPGEPPSRRVLDPLGLVVAGGRGYLLALRGGAERTYRLDRVRAATALDEPAARPAQIDLAALWVARSEAFRRGGDTARVRVRLGRSGLRELAATALEASIEPETEHDDAGAGEKRDGRVTATVTFQDEAHAHWALWALGTEVDILEPASLRARLRAAAERVAMHHGR